MSIIDSVCERISTNPRFVLEYEALVKNSILTTANLSSDLSLEEDTLGRLVQSAALFAQSARTEWRQLAYRISVGMLDYQGNLAGIAEAVRLTLARLGNYPAIGFAFREAASPRTLTESVFYEIEWRRSENTIQIGERDTTLTDMQKHVWDAVLSGASLALSAPTSSGKSFVFLGYIEQIKRTRPATNIVYIVPSRALISQVSSDLRKSGLDKAFGVSTVPFTVPATEQGSPIYVLTPERLQVLLQGTSDFRCDIAIVDEAHLIGEGSRGVVLHSVLQETKGRNPALQFLFSSPQVRDPSVFGGVVGASDVRVVKTDDSPVAQNLLLLRGDLIETKKLSLALWRGAENELPLLSLDARIPIYNSQDRLIYSAWEFGQGSQNLVYAEGPASAENMAIQIKNLLEDPQLAIEVVPHSVSEEITEQRKELSSLAREAVHQTYVLAETVTSGVGFHYGRIPALLRKAVEEAFSAGALDYIVCTSTLLQGVNMPARNIFMQNPHKGDSQPMEAVDFWNLAGRAGRLGKDFQGNVFLIDYESWETAPLSAPRDEPVRSSLATVLVDNSADLVEYISIDDRGSGVDPILEAAFTKLLRDLRHGRLDSTLSDIHEISPDVRKNVEEALTEANGKIAVETNTLDESPQISGYRQQELYDYMRGKIAENGPDYLIPLHPSAAWKGALDKLRPVFARVHKYLELKSGNTHRYWAPLALRWMRGEPLPRIVDSAIEYHKKQGKNRSNRVVIREVLADVENDLRFRYVNLLGCYTAVLKQALTDSGFVDVLPRVPSLSLYLELGAASQTMIHLMSFGLSRHTANLVADTTINKDMDQASARRFLRNFSPESAGLSPYLAREVRQVAHAL